MRTSGLAVLISANFLPHIAISNNSLPGIELIQDPAWGDKSWNIDREALQGLSANADRFDLALANGNPRLPHPSRRIQASLNLQQSWMVARTIRSQSGLEHEADDLRRNPQKAELCPLKLEPPYTQPTGESTETNTNNQQGTAGEEQPTGSPLQIPEQGDTGLQPTQDLNNEKAWQLNYAWLDTTCGSGSGNAQFWCSKIFASPVPGRPGKADICLTLDMIDRMEANGEFKNEMHPLILPP